MMISVFRVVDGNPLIGIEVIVCRNWLLLHTIVFMVSVLITFANPAGMNLPCPCHLILLLD